MEKNKDDDAGKKPAAAQKRRELFDSLHQEMEIAQYVMTETGQQRKKVPRHESADRTKKRKILEKVDHQKRSMTTDDTKRLRGSQYALEQDVIEGSKVYADEEKVDNNDKGMEVEVVEKTIEEDEEEAGDEKAEEKALEEEVVVPAAQSAAKPAPAKKPAAAKGKGKKRLMHKMRNFKSARMAERHGDALGAHARGQSLQAIRKLEEVAIDAPAAPQVYSSLGMVYESILSDSRKKSTAAPDEEEFSIKSIEKQLELAKKAYGSYHVAALLCKKDFSLWVRAGDTAKEIADLYTEAMSSSDTQSEKREEYREEKRKWTEEAKKDYLAADNLRPPGVDVPAKLAAAQMELGNLSEALVILTDLKNRSADTNETHSEFEKSYKAWLLYADLMLRIGHECTEWNNGNQSNPNYMFRRWLRKWSDSFDWKQRRLQALVQALEAAAGTTCCENLIAWSKNPASAAQGDERAPTDHRRWHVDSYEIAKDPPEAKKGGEERKDDDDAAGNDSTIGATAAASGQDSAWSLESVREALLANNKMELQAFDEETSNLGLVAGSDGLQQRVTARSALIKSHMKSVVDLVGNYQQHHTALEETTAAAPSGFAGDNGNSQRAAEPLPITGSCAAVCAIASELMKHCLRVNLYGGCRLVGEAVSAYLKERAELLERRLEANRTFAERQKSTAKSVLLSIEAYDEVGEDESDDDADALYFSDDEVILESSDEHLVPSLKNGILPPELRLLYALSLVGEGGRAFLARQCIKAIEVLEADDIDALVSDPIDTNIVKDPLWYGFRQDLTEPLRKTAAFVLVVDVLQKADKEAEFADIVTPLLQKHLENLESTGQIDIALFGSEAAVSTLAVPTRNRVIQLILASARMQIEHAKSIASVRANEAVDSALAVLDRVIPLLQKFWKVDASGSIPSFCIKGMELLARTFALLSSLAKDDQVEARVLAKLLQILSLVCGVVIPNPLTCALSDAENPFKDWTNFPVATGWQSMSEELLSKRLYNILIGCLVWNFSGWEMEEFNLDLMRAGKRKGQPFGLNITGERVTGYLSPSTEAELVNQWEQVVKLLPQFSGFDFKASLDAAKSSSWYKEVVDEMEKSHELLSAYGEKDAFELFVTLSRMCLEAANSAPADGMKFYALIKLALSVVLPLSEFCLDENLWESSIGKAAITKTAKMYDWNKVAKSVVQQKHGERVTKRARAQPKPKPVEAPPSKRRALPTMVRIPVSSLLSQWNDGMPAKRIDGEEAKEAMRKVNVATKNLRECYSETAIQKGCIQVALSLMELVGSGYCYNPFLCLQQAAIFASQGSKGGNNDEAFKAGLPKEQECSPQEALLIIGRADCLHSLDFADEAIYLCSYVARVCRLHRDRRETQAEWNNKWKVVGICLYNLSVAIRTTRSLHDERSPPEYWDESITEELKRGRADAAAIMAALPETTGVAAIVDHEGEGESHDDDEDNFDDNDQQEQVGTEETYLDGEVEMIDVNGEYNFRPSASMFASHGGGLDNDEEREIVAV